MKLLTIFTPTYNRARTLKRTYESLRRQECNDFVWLIVDDGSSDNTRQLAEKWINDEKNFEIQYIYKTNGGMHTAHNTAYENISTELNMCIDSDDMLAEDAVNKIINKWNGIKRKTDACRYAGLVGLDADFKGNIIGKGFPKGLKETTLTDYYASGGKGDKKLVYRTDVIKSCPPYPVFEKEKYVPLGYKYRLIDQRYKLAVINEILCNVEYQQDGSSLNMYSQYIKNPRGFAFWRRVCMEYPTDTIRLFADCVHYVSSSIQCGNKAFIQESPRKFLTLTAVPLGCMLNRYIKFKNKRRGQN